MIKRKRKQIFSTRSWKYTFPKENQRTQELIERSLILGAMWNWDEDSRYSQVLFLNFIAQRYAIYSLSLKLRNYMLSLMNEVDPCVASTMGFVWDAKPVFSNKYSIGSIKILLFTLIENLKIYIENKNVKKFIMKNGKR